ncbi:hypothetical protein [Paracoccus solventivorans]|uniref:hypothetical protein n=1 Tax=Paracoccus solventivorans TaxID=53463 RepID=UPI0011604A6D|nr:hypothetical protein [Paracoccus solventivorans]
MASIITVITSIVVSYATAKLTSYSKDVTGERKEWRDQIRKMAVEAVRLMQLNETKSQRFMDIVSEFQIRLNPDDRDDKDILISLRASMNGPNSILEAKFLAQISRLLKHDWERAKSESSVLGIFSKSNSLDMRRLRSTDYLE